MFSKVDWTQFSAVSVYSNPCGGPLPRSKIYFFLLSICKVEHISTSKIITFLPISLPSEKTPSLPNPIPYPEYFYWSISGSFVNLTAPNKQFSSVG